VRSDVYSLGVILYEMLTGETPFSGSNPVLVLNAKARCDPPSPRKIAPDILPALEEIVLQAMARNTADRHQSARELAWALEHQDEVVCAGAHPRALNPQRSARQKSGFLYALLGLIPLTILALLLYVAGHF
jgi:serine/threonine protein kinase